MKFIALLFAFFALQLSASTECIYKNHLDTAEGRATFLTEKILPIQTAAQQLNQEIQSQAQTIKTLSAEEDPSQILALTDEMNQKMAVLLQRLEILQSCLSIEEDFQQIDEILKETPPLSAEQQQVLDRVQSLCNQIELLAH